MCHDCFSAWRKCLCYLRNSHLNEFYFLLPFCEKTHHTTNVTPSYTHLLSCLFDDSASGDQCSPAALEYEPIRSWLLWRKLYLTPSMVIDFDISLRVARQNQVFMSFHCAIGGIRSVVLIPQLPHSTMAIAG